MDIQDIAREHVFAKTLAERDEMVISLHQQLTEANKKVEELQRAQQAAASDSQE